MEQLQPQHKPVKWKVLSKKQEYRYKNWRLEAMRYGRSRRPNLFFSLSLVAFVLFCLRYMGYPPFRRQTVFEPSNNFEPGSVPKDGVELVVASIKEENMTWLNDYLPYWKKSIYIANDPTAELTVPKNKGKEAMVYLTYIIDRYDSLPGNIIFHHGGRFQWHTDDPHYDGLPQLRDFRLQHLKKVGYANLRCSWLLGCPAEISPEVNDDPDPNTPAHAQHVYKKAFMELFPGKQVPEVVAVPCCAEFAVRRELIRKRPRKDWIRYREWLMNTELDDKLSGRVMEYSWHMMLGRQPVHCPDVKKCYCEMYGKCNLTCGRNACVGQYKLPRYLQLPGGWPHTGWDGEDRKWTGLP